MIKKIKLKENTTDKEYTKLCNELEKLGKFVSCGSCDDKWIIADFEDPIDFLAFCVAKVGRNKREKRVEN